MGTVAERTARSKAKARSGSKERPEVKEASKATQATQQSVQEPVQESAQLSAQEPAMQLVQDSMQESARAKRMAQINVRIDADLKQRGEAGLAEAGLSPSAAVRMLYEFAAANERTPSKIEKALSCEDDVAKAARKAEREERLRTWREGIERIHAMIHENGWDGYSEIDNMSYEELKAQAYAEKYGI